MFSDLLCQTRAELVGKKVFLANEDAAIASPEVTLTNALNQAVYYVQPAQSVVGFGGVSGIKNIVAVTACPTGVAHTFMSAEAIEAYGKKTRLAGKSRNAWPSGRR